ncbi:acyl-CoA dehydrogenase family protein [Streptomyces sp. NPDC004031]
MMIENPPPTSASARIPAQESGTRPAALAAVLYEDGPGEWHGLWRKAVSTDVFRHAPHLPDRERWAQAYARLRALHDEVPDPAALACDVRGLAALHEWTGQVDGATATVAGIHFNLFLGSVLDDTATEPAHDVREFTSLRRTGVFLCTERAHGNDVGALETTATWDPADGGFVLHTPHPGAAKFMPNTGPAGGPKTAVVAARLLARGTDHGVFLLLAPLTGEDGAPLPGVRIEELPRRAGDPVDHCATAFEHVRLPPGALLQGRHGRLRPDGTLDAEVGSVRRRVLHAIRRVTVGKLCMSAATAGGARAALAVAVRYGELRVVSGAVPGSRVPVNALRSHAAPLLRATATAYAMTLWHRRVVRRWIGHSPHERAAAERLVGIAKGWITWQARDVIAECRERVGARGLFPANALPDYYANAEGAVTAEGDNLPVWCKAGSEMVFGQSLPAAPPPPTGTESLTDPRFLLGRAAAAERHWQLRARERMRDAPAGSPLERWNHASGAAVELVRAHAVRAAGEALAAAGERCADPRAAALLDGLAALFLLDHLRASTGPLLADGALTPRQAGAWSGARDDLTGRLAPYLPLLTAAFEVPEEHLQRLPLLREPL